MRTFAVGDIHGCARALDRVLQAIALTPDDLLITLGDYVDRGPDSKGVLDRLLRLHATGRLIALTGNHEEMFLDAANPEKTRALMWRACGGNQTLASYGPVTGTAADLALIPSEHWQFLREACRDSYETPTHLFVHGNVEPDVPFDKQAPTVLRWDKLHDARPHVSGKVMVCGHTRQVEGRPLDLGFAVCIDTGAYSVDGWLTCLEVETGRYVQANQKGELREGRLESSPHAPRAGE